MTNITQDIEAISLNDRLRRRAKKLEQRRNRLKQMTASFNTQVRKQRTRRLIQLGGLVEKANLQGWNSNALYGALLFVKEKEVDIAQVENWAAKGGVAFSADKLLQRSSYSKI